MTEAREGFRGTLPSFQLTGRKAHQLLLVLGLHLVVLVALVFIPLTARSAGFVWYLATARRWSSCNFCFRGDCAPASKTGYT